MFELLQKLPDCEDVTKENLVGLLDRDKTEELMESYRLNLAAMDTIEEDDNTNDEIAEPHKVSLDESLGRGFEICITVTKSNNW
ncbi:hypothetical protein Trydic_g9650 [Trypoxylus dichotomus]